MSILNSYDICISFLAIQEIIENNKKISLYQTIFDDDKYDAL